MNGRSALPVHAASSNLFSNSIPRTAPAASLSRPLHAGQAFGQFPETPRLPGIAAGLRGVGSVAAQAVRDHPAGTVESAAHERGGRGRVEAGAGAVGADIIRPLFERLA